MCVSCIVRSRHCVTNICLVSIKRLLVFCTKDGVTRGDFSLLYGENVLAIGVGCRGRLRTHAEL
jgi:hypothetical protein